MTAVANGTLASVATPSNKTDKVVDKVTGKQGGQSTSSQNGSDKTSSVTSKVTAESVTSTLPSSPSNSIATPAENERVVEVSATPSSADKGAGSTAEGGKVKGDVKSATPSSAKSPNAQSGKQKKGSNKGQQQQQSSHDSKKTPSSSAVVEEVIAAQAVSVSSAAPPGDSLYTERRDEKKGVQSSSSAVPGEAQPAVTSEEPLVMNFGKCGLVDPSLKPVEDKEEAHTVSALSASPDSFTATDKKLNLSEPSEVTSESKSPAGKKSQNKNKKNTPVQNKKEEHRQPHKDTHHTEQGDQKVCNVDTVELVGQAKVESCLTEMSSLSPGGDTAALEAEDQGKGWETKSKTKADKTNTNKKGSSGQDAKGFSGQDAKGFSGQDAKGSSGQDAKGSSGQDAKVSTGQDAKVSTGQDAKVSTGQDAKVSTGQDAKVSIGQDAKISTEQDAKSSVEDSRHLESVEQNPIASGDISQHGIASHGQVKDKALSTKTSDQALSKKTSDEALSKKTSQVEDFERNLSEKKSHEELSLDNSPTSGKVTESKSLSAPKKDGNKAQEGKNKKGKNAAATKKEEVTKVEEPLKIEQVADSKEDVQKTNVATSKGKKGGKTQNRESAVKQQDKTKETKQVRINEMSVPQNVPQKGKAAQQKRAQGKGHPESGGVATSPCHDHDHDHDHDHHEKDVLRGEEGENEEEDDFDMDLDSEGDEASHHHVHGEACVNGHHEQGGVKDGLGKGLSQHATGDGTDTLMSESGSKVKQSRSEKKARKALSRMGLKPVRGVTQITMRKNRNVLFIIDRPDVFRAPGSETYVVFGEARIEDLDERAKHAAAEKFKATETSGSTATDTTRKLPHSADLPLSEVEGQETLARQASDDEQVDESGIETKDIELVMSQASVSRSRAITALRNNNNDIVNAIMELTL